MMSKGEVNYFDIKQLVGSGLVPKEKDSPIQNSKSQELQSYKSLTKEK